jgi:hypothetical protein
MHKCRLTACQLWMEFCCPHVQLATSGHSIGCKAAGGCGAPMSVTPRSCWKCSANHWLASNSHCQSRLDSPWTPAPAWLLPSLLLLRALQRMLPGQQPCPMAALLPGPHRQTHLLAAQPAPGHAATQKHTQQVASRPDTNHELTLPAVYHGRHTIAGRTAGL